jgi:hypothetical protein
MRKNQRDTYMTIWHVTHKKNIDSILKCGIDPAYAQGSFNRVWLVRWYGIAWALLHISLKKRVPIWELVAFKVHVLKSRTVHFNRNVYTCKLILYTSSYKTSDQILSAIERQREFKRSYRPATFIDARVENDLSWLGE